MLRLSCLEDRRSWRRKQRSLTVGKESYSPTELQVVPHFFSDVSFLHTFTLDVERFLLCEGSSGKEWKQPVDG